MHAQRRDIYPARRVRTVNAPACVRAYFRVSRRQAGRHDRGIDETEGLERPVRQWKRDNHGVGAGFGREFKRSVLQLFTQEFEIHFHCGVSCRDDIPLSRGGDTRLVNIQPYPPPPIYKLRHFMAGCPRSASEVSKPTAHEFPSVLPWSMPRRRYNHTPLHPGLFKIPSTTSLTALLNFPPASRNNSPALPEEADTASTLDAPNPIANASAAHGTWPPKTT